MKRIQGLVAATHSPFGLDGELKLEVVERQAARLLSDGVKTAFIGGTTGECTSMTTEERMQLTQRWSEVVRGSELRFVVHVGSNALSDSQALASQAEKLGAAAVAAFAPSYFKPPNLAALIAFTQALAAAAPSTPFYFYDIPSLTGVHLSMRDYLVEGSQAIPNLVGLKFTNSDLIAYQRCRELQEGRFDILFGIDEILLAAKALGSDGAVGSTYNFAASIYHRLLSAFDRNDLVSARREQNRSVQLVQTLAQNGYMASAKFFMKLRGVDVGPPRLPLAKLTKTQEMELEEKLQADYSDLF